MLVSHKKITVPDSKRLYVVGDIHGCFDLYQKGVKDLGIKDDDIIISLSDLVDRGNKNFACVSEFYQNPNRVAILGNHEHLMIEGFLKKSRQHFHCWFSNGGDTTWDECGGAGCELIAAMVANFPVILDVQYGNQRLGFIHGGVPAGKLSFDEVIREANKNPDYLERLVWDRSIIDDYRKKGNTAPAISDVDYVFHGHSPVKQPTLLNNRVYMDTGGVFNNKLTFAYFNKGDLCFYTTGDHDDL